MCVCVCMCPFLASVHLCCSHQTMGGEVFLGSLLAFEKWHEWTPFENSGTSLFVRRKGKAGCNIGGAKRRWVMSTLMKAPAASVHGVAVGTISTLLSPSVPWLRGSGGPPRRTRGTVTLEAIKDRQRHLANRGDAWWGEAGEGEWNGKGKKEAKSHTRNGVESGSLSLRAEYYRLAVSGPLVSPSGE